MEKGDGEGKEKENWTKGRKGEQKTEKEDAEREIGEEGETNGKKKMRRAIWWVVYTIH